MCAHISFHKLFVVVVGGLFNNNEKMSSDGTIAAFTYLCRIIGHLVVEFESIMRWHLVRLQSVHLLFALEIVKLYWKFRSHHRMEKKRKPPTNEPKSYDRNSDPRNVASDGALSRFNANHAAHTHTHTHPNDSHIIWKEMNTTWLVILMELCWLFNYKR